MHPDNPTSEQNTRLWDNVYLKNHHCKAMQSISLLTLGVFIWVSIDVCWQNESYQLANCEHADLWIGRRCSAWLVSMSAFSLLSSVEARVLSLGWIIRWFGFRYGAMSCSRTPHSLFTYKWVRWLISNHVFVVSVQAAIWKSALLEASAQWERAMLKLYIVCIST